MYKEFVRKRTVEGEQKYKAYKITIIMRNSKTDYYSKLFDKQKQHKNTWDILKRIFKKELGRQTILTTSWAKITVINDMNMAVNEFNTSSVGTNLAKDIAMTGSRENLESKSVNIKETIFF